MKKLHRMRATGDFKVLHFKVLRVAWLESQRIRVTYYRENIIGYKHNDDAL